MQNLNGLTYFVHAFGCQMNKHDAERVCGMLDSCGCYQVSKIDDSDIVIFLTCCVREAADVRLFGQLESIKNVPLRKNSPISNRKFVLGGCIAQRDGEKLLEKYDFLDIVIGTQKLSCLTTLLRESVLDNKRSCLNPEKSDEFASDLPAKREKTWSAWLPITSGCNNFCTYCIVPYVRGREKSREIEDIVKEANNLVKDGVKEITLLGQNVNSYGRDLYGSPKFYDILNRVSETGVERLRFLTSHPKDLSDDVIGLFGKLDNLMPAIHLPLQAGSNRVLKEMNRKYTFDHYFELIQKLRDARPDIAISTDIIVGFPGETETDFEQTLLAYEQVQYSSAFTFIYSKRKGTPAAEIVDNTPREIIQERYDELGKLVQKYAYLYNSKFLNKNVVGIVEGISKKNNNVLRCISKHSQVVHVDKPDGLNIDDLVGRTYEIKIIEPKTWYLTGEII